MVNPVGKPFGKGTTDFMHSLTDCKSQVQFSRQEMGKDKFLDPAVKRLRLALPALAD